MGRGLEIQDQAQSVNTVASRLLDLVGHDPAVSGHDSCSVVLDDLFGSTCVMFGIYLATLVRLV